MMDSAIMQKGEPMSRAIDAEALSEVLMRKLGNRSMQGFGKGLLLANSCVIHAPTIEPEPQWTPVSERFPDKDGWYICSIKDERVNSLYWDNRRARWVDNVRIHMFDLYTIRSKLTNEEIRMEQEAVYWDGWVTAWMPLPEPYKGGEQDGSD